MVNNLINITEGTSLAIHGLGLLAAQAPQRVSMKQAARQLLASEAHLAKVFNKLQKKGWVSSARGPTGGFSLLASPDVLTFLDVYELFQDKVQLNTCPLGRSCCPFDNCMFDGRIHKLNIEVYKTLQNTSISDLQSIAEQGKND